MIPAAPFFLAAILLFLLSEFAKPHNVRYPNAREQSRANHQIHPSTRRWDSGLSH